MPLEDSSAPTARDIHQALDLMEEQNPALGEIIAAFRPLLAAQAALSSDLPPLDSDPPALDALRLAQGMPLAGVDDFLACPGLDLPQYFDKAARETLPALEQGLPALAAHVNVLQNALANGNLDGPTCLKALLGGRREEFQGWADQAGLEPDQLSFTMIQLAKPLLQRRALGLAPLLEDQPWERGACPICGSLPEMAFLKGTGGQRWLLCSLCAHRWRFKRIACPICANEDHDALEYFYAEGREHERVDYCTRCGKYLLTLDTRGLDAQPLWEVASLGLVHLEILAQERGLGSVNAYWARVNNTQ